MKKYLLFLAIVSFTVSPMAADFDLYGKIAFGAWWMKTERFYDDSTGIAIDTTVMPYDTTTVMETDSIPINTMSFNPYGTFGVKFTGGRFSGCVEMGCEMNVYDSKLGGSPTFLSNYMKRTYFIKMQKWYAEWYINDNFTLLLGQDITPAFFSPSNQTFMGGRGLHSTGCLASGFNGAYPMFQLSIHDANQLFKGKVAVIRVDTTVVEYLRKSGHSVSYLCETGLPKIEGCFGVNIDKKVFGFNGKIAGGFQRYNSVVFQDKISADDCRLPITSYILGADIGVKLGPAKLAFDVFSGQNIGAYGVRVGDEWGWWRIMEETDDSRPFYYMKPFYPIHDYDTLGYDTLGDAIRDTVFYNSKVTELAVVLNIKPWDFLAFEGGGGMVIGEHENENIDKNWDPTYAWYFQIEATLFENLKITPEVGRYLYGPLFGFGRYIYWGLNTSVVF